ncbi:hypothetical protein TSOC_002198 [Tetrabaena socialis]|uniref:Uncharacterized protein n=1 Tax=Tetrabaena socialis TaxID=47790 RepID=A0A2J8AER8_9CHLO|nr:hypothetical protein TSOC_002198 [Tetrabaena socialis]|eukprot:PNH10999.1 hypothetical protein TSOC_002198 [Tetrabaena socialis]
MFRSSTYTVFHGEAPPLPAYVPKYQTNLSTALPSRHGSSPYSFSATAAKVGTGPDGRPSYRYGAGALPKLEPKVSSNTLGSSGLPPLYSTEYVDEYREPVEHLDTLKTLTQKFDTTGGYRVTQRSTRSAGEPKYESRVVAF